MKKLFDGLIGLWKVIFQTRIFDPTKVFAGKRVAIVGPADSAYEIQNSKYIDDFDFVIRVNKAPHSWNKEKAKFIGSKLDVLFHSFFENEDSGGGLLDEDLMNFFNVEYLVNPRSGFDSYRRTFNFFRKYKTDRTVYHLSLKFYNAMVAPFGELKPTIGYTALYSVLNSPCNELFITGFTFFKTPYAEGYRDHLIDKKANEKHFEKQGIHDADLEFRLFMKELSVNNCERVIYDRKLEGILKSN